MDVRYKVNSYTYLGNYQPKDPLVNSKIPLAFIKNEYPYGEPYFKKELINNIVCGKIPPMYNGLSLYDYYASKGSA